MHGGRDTLSENSAEFIRHLVSLESSMKPNIFNNKTFNDIELSWDGILRTQIIAFSKFDCIIMFSYEIAAISQQALRFMRFLVDFSR